ncbi:Acetyltransferase-like protein [Lysobacter dokdonensis DS-58]|uniref:Acetyltransferase-like protein n=1 Tax=Lysobacter dokdonensis DS-58 TaxID=1300345 RepID=A0A0A2WKX1_9GAMM|nr:GNAT family N-acetyltransferase [Lysobacter dokdonensis]KGQ20458.1 Acetyltransferase-like protein [Lysobacter dokdonensis DS-58]
MTDASTHDIAARIRHDADAGPGTQGRFSVTVDDVEAELVYGRDSAGQVTILHTGVPQAIGGRGVAGELVRAALDWVRAQGLKVHTACSYSRAWVARHPEYSSLTV